MKKIKLNKIDLSYFLSTGELVTHDFIEDPLFIKGRNDTAGQVDQNNGCGKSVIFLDGVMFAFYGVVSREDFKMADIPYRFGGKKRCVVALSFDIDMNGKTVPAKITRSINPSKLVVEVDGVDVSQSHSKTTQEYIVKEVLGGISIDVFKNSIAMRLDKSKSFMSMGKPEREKFIGGVFDLTYLKEAEKMARDEYNLLHKDILGLEGKVSVLVPRVTHIEGQIEESIIEAKEKKSAQESNLKRLDTAIDDFVVTEAPVELSIDEETSAIDAKFKTLNDKERNIKDSCADIERTGKTLKSDISRLNSDNDKDALANLKDEQSKVCPTCERDMDEDCMHGIQKVIKGRVIAIAGRENEIEVKTEAINKSREEYSTVSESLKTGVKIREILDKQRSEINSRITANQTEIRNHTQYMGKLTLLNQKRDSYVLEMGKEDDNSVVDRQKADLLQTETELSNIRLDLDVKAKKLEVLNHVKVLYSDQGIRRSILGNIVTLFNNNVNLYLRRLEAPCTVEFDDTFNYTMKTLGGIEIPYGSLSGGESLRVTTALAFTFKDILRIQNQISFSVSIYDEWFDVAIDERGLEVVGEILSERKDKYGEIPYIITHRTQLQIEDAQSLTVVKENNTSRIEQ
jgi:hypothetical protein